MKIMLWNPSPEPCALNSVMWVIAWGRPGTRGEVTLMGLLGAARKIPITGNSSERKLDIPPVRTRTSFVSKHGFLRFFIYEQLLLPQKNNTNVHTL
jgi:hypothetical protein